jgi:NADPH:quinone reductase-like Zn-dependent oxidoreductase
MREIVWGMCSKTMSLAMRPDRQGLTALKELIEAGKVTPVIDKSFPLSDLAEALRYYAEGRSRGRVVIEIVR